MNVMHDRQASRTGKDCSVVALLFAALVLCAIPRFVPAAQPGDTEPNEVVDLRDLLSIRNAFGQTGPPGFTGADVDSNGVVDDNDLLLWRVNFPFIGTPLSPYLFIAAPLDGSLIGNRRPTIVVDYGATSLGVDPNTLTVNVDGQDRTADAIKTFTNASIPIDQALLDGAHYVEVTIQDTQGTQAMDRSDFAVTSITPLPRATPQVGPAPLLVTFKPDVVWADSAPAWYRWDWNNDLVWEIVDPRPDLRTFTFLEEGVQTINFQVQQSDGTIADSSIKVGVTESFASASPSNGTGPLSVFLHGIAADLDDPIVLYEWDWDYSGVFSADYSSATNPNVAHVYVFPGVYEPVFRATHQSSAMVEYPIVQEEVHVKAAGSPTAVASAAQGVNALTVNFSGSGSDDGSIALYEWDFENDGIWDYSSPTSGNVSHTYPTAGEKVAALRVTDNDTNTSIDRVRVETFAPATLEVLDDTILQGMGETVTIRTSITIAATVRLYIRAEDQTLTTGEVVKGRVIRTLVDNVLRTAGTYDDTWDGLDFRFEPTHPGAYFAVLEYTYPGRTDTVDNADTTGGNHYFAPIIGVNPSSFTPFEDDFLDMNFNIPSASYASLYVLPGGTNRTNTLFDRDALGAGDYTAYWSGLTSEGVYADTRTYLWSVNAWTLGDNAIVVRGRPELPAVSIDPNYYSPADRPTGNPPLDVNFDLSERSVVVGKIIRLDNGITVHSFQTSFLDVGLHNVQWDGRTTGGERVSPGEYSVLLIAVDEHGNSSIQREGLVQVRY